MRTTYKSEVENYEGRSGDVRERKHSESFLDQEVLQKKEGKRESEERIGWVEGRESVGATEFRVRYLPSRRQGPEKNERRLRSQSPNLPISTSL